MLEIELPIEEWVNNYPHYVDNKEEYFKFRPFFTKIPEGTIGAEVGTFEGYNALGICKYCNPKKIYLIDPYLVYDSQSDTKIWSQGDWENIYKRAKLKLKDYPAEFIRESSLQGASSVPDGLDWVYIDGDHTTEAVLSDINTWFPKVKEGGIIGGHDIIEVEVLNAVLIWMYNNKKDNSTFNSKWNDWWIIK